LATGLALIGHKEIILVLWIIFEFAKTPFSMDIPSTPI